jgi:hypothetical protein
MHAAAAPVSQQQQQPTLCSNAKLPEAVLAVMAERLHEELAHPADPAAAATAHIQVCCTVITIQVTFGIQQALKACIAVHQHYNWADSWCADVQVAASAQRNAMVMRRHVTVVIPKALLVASS